MVMSWCSLSLFLSLSFSLSRSLWHTKQGNKWPLSAWDSPASAGIGCFLQILEAFWKWLGAPSMASFLFIRWCDLRSNVAKPGLLSVLWFWWPYQSRTGSHLNEEAFVSLLHISLDWARTDNRRPLEAMAKQRPPVSTYSFGCRVVVDKDVEMNVLETLTTAHTHRHTMTPFLFRKAFLALCSIVC